MTSVIDQQFGNSYASFNNWLSDCPMLQCAFDDFGEAMCYSSCKFVGCPLSNLDLKVGEFGVLIFCLKDKLRSCLYTLK